MKIELTSRARLTLLALGAAAGLAMAAAGLVDRRGVAGGPLPGHAVARVGERLIPRERYLQLLADFAADRRGGLTADDRRFVLDRLVDEELLIMRGVELGLAETAPEIRKAVAAAVIAQLAAEAEAGAPGEADLRELYENDRGFFAAPPRYRVRWWRAADAGRENTGWVGELAGRPDPEAVLQGHGYLREPALPDTPLPPAKLADYLGPDLARRAGGMAPGEFSGPVEAGGAWHVLELVERQPGELPAFEAARPVVEAEYRRRAGDRALREYLGWLRQRTPVVIDPGAVADPGPVE